MILGAEQLPARVKEQSIAVFTALAEAEAATHGVTLDKVGEEPRGGIGGCVLCACPWIAR